MEICCIIPARGGSKGLSKKNILPLAGKPLLNYSIEAAKKCALINRVIVNTDSQEIADIAKQAGAEVPFLRPAELATDNALTNDVLKHTVEWLEINKHYTCDIVVYLQPTDIFRRKHTIPSVIDALSKNPKLDSAFIAYPEHKNYWKKQGNSYVRIDSRGYAPRQQKEPIFREDTGLACASRVSVIKKGQRIGENVMIIPNDDPASFIDIHDQFSFWLAEKVITDWRYPINE